MSLAFKYTDHRPTYDNTDSYQCTNEQLDRLRELTALAAPTHIGAIASAGEVPLGILLNQPNVQTCVAIDQAYGSLMWHFRKAVIIQLFDAERAYRILTNQEVIHIKEHQAIDELTPTRLRSISEPGYGVAKHWLYTVTIDQVGLTKANLHKLHLIHGDIRDLPEFNENKYDLIYLSNATSKNNYANDKLTLDDFVGFLSKGGHILTTGIEEPTEDYRVVKALDRIQGHPASSNNWTYRLIQHRILPSNATERMLRMVRAQQLRKMADRGAYRYRGTVGDIFCNYCRRSQLHVLYTPTKWTCNWCYKETPVEMSTKAFRYERSQAHVRAYS